MLRLLITTGVLLMVVGFGTAGWQYWQNSVATAPGTSPVADGTDVWLGTPTGGIVPAEVTAGFLLQDRFVPGRIATILRTAALTDLLRDGESLPDPVFLEVMADIRAPLLAEGLCPVLTGSIAADCATFPARSSTRLMSRWRLPPTRPWRRPGRWKLRSPRWSTPASSPACRTAQGCCAGSRG
ncbi:MAG: hypothetical protein B7Z10_09950 [Rhodobacterales bacterium 32-66-7]|nr:MAG: hypothetical protein B7Z10_09950 [Rhodobacterales bacterium 32-66-7]